ncbi:hypothetical protein IKE79_01170 [Candidatus Saccharibacteria bacterium]|nr:hypothetical protein [Candidatus Saccharibacteria bacterium]
MKRNRLMEWAMGAGVLVLVITGVVGGIMTKGLSSAVAELAVVETERAEPAQVIARSSEVYEGKVFGNELPREEVFDDEIFREDGAVIAYSGDAGYEKPLGESITVGANREKMLTTMISAQVAVIGMLVMVAVVAISWVWKCWRGDHNQG